MATDTGILEALRRKQQEEGLSLRGLALELGVSHVLLSLLYQAKRPLTAQVRANIQRYVKPKPSARLKAILEQFILSSAHRSPKTVQTLQERLEPFADYLAAQGVADPLAIFREDIDGFLRTIAAGRRGRPLSPASLFGFTKDVQAFMNHVGNTVAADDWRNPVRTMPCKEPHVVIRPLSQAQVAALFDIAAALAPTPLLKARNAALLLVLIDGALRISELLTALRHELAVDGILRVLGKGQKEREVALAPRTLEAIGAYLAQRRDSSPFLFATDEGGPLTYHAVKSLFHRWKRAAPGAFQGVRLSPHTLRHTLAESAR